MESVQLIERLLFADLAHGESDMNQNPIASSRRVVHQQSASIWRRTPTTSTRARLGSSADTSITLAGIARHILQPPT